MKVQAAPPTSLKGRRRSRRLHTIWNGWKQFSLWCGAMLGRVWLTVFYGIQEKVWFVVPASAGIFARQSSRLRDYKLLFLEVYTSRWPSPSPSSRA